MKRSDFRFRGVDGHGDRFLLVRRDGICVRVVEAAASRARDFDDDRLEEYAELVNRAAEEAAVGRGVTVEVDIRRQYSNMKRFIEDPRIVGAAEEAVRRAGMEPKREIIRGGTDGSRLSEKGLPCPNLSTGGHDYHSRREWICVNDMGAAASTIVHLAQVWSEPR